VFKIVKVEKGRWYIEEMHVGDIFFRVICKLFFLAVIEILTL
jgi:hypothetical protein